MEEGTLEPPQKFTRLSPGKSSSSKSPFFCGLFESKLHSLCRASTFGADFHLRQCAMKVKYEKLLAKLSAGDMISQDILYHLVSLYIKATEKKCLKVIMLMN